MREELRRMGIFHILLWIVYPYMVMAIMGMGIVWQYNMENPHVQQNDSVVTGRKLKASVISLMFLSILTGLAVILNNEPMELFRWVVSLIQLNPNIDLIRNISILSQTHLFLILTFLLLLSFTNYLPYLFKPHRFFVHK